MSLFDLDDDGSLSSSSSVEHSCPTELTRNEACVGGRADDANAHRSGSSLCSCVNAVDGVRAVSCVKSRYTLTEEDVQLAEAKRRVSAADSLARRGGGAYMTKSSNGFGESIRAAMRARQADAELQMVRRIRKQRREEAKDAGLQEKDAGVGVFVTPAYQALLQRHVKGVGAVTDGKETQSSSTSDGRAKHVHGATNNLLHEANQCTPVVEEQDDDEPLGAYIRQLDKNGGSRCNLALTRMETEISAHKDKESEGAAGMRHSSMSAQSTTATAERCEGNTTEADTAERVSLCMPTLEELRALAGLDQIARANTEDTTETRDAMIISMGSDARENADAQSSVRKDMAKDAAEVHRRALYAAREVAKRRRASASDIADHAARCAARIASFVHYVKTR